MTPGENYRSPFHSIPEPMESLARVVALLLLLRAAYVALCVALVIAMARHRFVDGVLQARDGFPSSPWFWAGLVVAVLGGALHVVAFRR